MTSIATLLTGQPVHTVLESVTALDAARSMAENRVGAMLVMGRDGRPAGIFTERDLMTRVVVAGRDPARTPLAEVMTRNMYTCRPEQSIAEVSRELQERHIRHLPVFDGSRVLGMLSLRDLLRYDLKQRAGEVAALTQYIQGPPEGQGC
jgi:CBS domain-containing protein